MLRYVRGGKRRIRHRGALLAIAVLAAVSVAALPTASASASWYAGCTYSWAKTCFTYQGYIDYLITQDPDSALATWGTLQPQNGYKAPKHDGVERDVCGTISESTTHIIYEWTCNWGTAARTYPTTYGIATIGSGIPYYNIALYQMVNYGS